jgi:hypothetical protein
LASGAGGGAPGERAVDGRDQPRVVPGLGDEIAGPALERLDRQRHICISRERDDGGPLRQRRQAVEHRQPLGAVDTAGSEVEVEEHHVGHAPGQQCRQPGRIVQRGDAAIAPPQQQLGCICNVGVVVEDQDVGCLVGHRMVVIGVELGRF